MRISLQLKLRRDFATPTALVAVMMSLCELMGFSHGAHAQESPAFGPYEGRAQWAVATAKAQDDGVLREEGLKQVRQQIILDRDQEQLALARSASACYERILVSDCLRRNRESVGALERDSRLAVGRIDVELRATQLAMRLAAKTPKPEPSPVPLINRARRDPIERAPEGRSINPGPRAERSPSEIQIFEQDRQRRIAAFEHARSQAQEKRAQADENARRYQEKLDAAAQYQEVIRQRVNAKSERNQAR